MDKDYTTYSADQLLNDDFFIQSELHPTEKSRAFWSDLQIKSAHYPKRSKMPVSSYTLLK